MADSRQPNSLQSADSTESNVPEWLSDWVASATSLLLSPFPDSVKSKVIMYKGYIVATISSLPTTYTKRLPFLIIILLFSPKLFVVLIFIGLGFVWGYIHGVPTISATETVAKWRDSRRINGLTVSVLRAVDGGEDSGNTEPLWSVLPNARLKSVRRLLV